MIDVLLEKATRQHLKGHNSRLVLRAIYDAGEISRAALARLTQLTRTTVSEVVADLIEQGLVQEVGQGPAGVGRTPTLLSVVDDARSIVAVDITHSEIQGALLNLRGVIRRQARLPLSGQDGRVATDRVPGGLRLGHPGEGGRSAHSCTERDRRASNDVHHGLASSRARGFIVLARHASVVVAAAATAPASESPVVTEP